MSTSLQDSYLNQLRKDKTPVVIYLANGVRLNTITEEKRKEVRLPSLKQANREPKYICTAAMLGLGVDDPSEINLMHI